MINKLIDMAVRKIFIALNGHVTYDITKCVGLLNLQMLIEESQSKCIKKNSTVIQMQLA